MAIPDVDFDWDWSLDGGGGGSGGGGSGGGGSGGGGGRRRRRSSSPNGTAFEASGLSEKAIEAVVSAATGQMRNVAHDSGKRMGVQSDLASGSVKVILSADKDSSEAVKVLNRLNSMMDALGGSNFSARGANLVDRTYNMYDPATIAAAKADGLRQGADVTYRRASNELRYTAEQGDAVINTLSGNISSDRRKTNEGQTLLAKNRRKLTREEDYAQRLAAFAAANPTDPLAIQEAYRRKDVTNRGALTKLYRKEANALDWKSQQWNAKVQWAKRNRRNPFAQAILKQDRQRSIGGRMLNKASASIKAAAAQALMTIIATAVKAAVKFLSDIPNIMNDVRELRYRGSRLNIQGVDLSKHEALSAALLGGDKGAFNEFFAAIHRKAASVINNDFEGALGKFAALSSLAGGKTIEALVDYFAEPGGSPLKSSHAAITDLVRASMMRQTVHGTVSDAKGGMRGAYQTNVADFMATFDEKATLMADGLFNTWLALQTEAPRLYEDIRKRVVENGEDFVELMFSLVPQSTFDKALPMVAHEAAQVQRRADNLKVEVKTSAEAVKVNLAATFGDNLIEWVRNIYYKLLEIINNIPGLQGSQDLLLAERYLKNRAKNEETLRHNEEQRKMIMAGLNPILTIYNMSDSSLWDSWIEEYKTTGARPRNMSKEEADYVFSELAVLEHMRKVDEKIGRENASNTPNEVGGRSTSGVRLDYLRESQNNTTERLLKWYDKYKDKPDELRSVMRHVYNEAFNITVEMENQARLQAKRLRDRNRAATVKSPGTLGNIETPIDPDDYKQFVLDFLVFAQSMLDEPTSIDPLVLRRDNAKDASEKGELGQLQDQVRGIMAAAGLTDNDLIEAIYKGEVKVIVKLEGGERASHFYIHDTRDPNNPNKTIHHTEIENILGKTDEYDVFKPYTQIDRKPRPAPKRDSAPRRQQPGLSYDDLL